MNYSVKTTHVVPSQLPPVRMARVTTLLVCRYCMSTIGAYSTLADRTRIESSHMCAEKLGLKRPSISVPFN